MPQGRSLPPLWLRRFGWPVLIWIARVGALAVVAMAFRLLMGMAGMTA